MTSKKQVFQKIRRETKPQKGFDQWIFVLERRRLSDDAGLLLDEAQLNGHVEWSGSISVTLPDSKKVAPDGGELTREWDKQPAREEQVSGVHLRDARENGNRWDQRLFQVLVRRRKVARPSTVVGTARRLEWSVWSQVYTGYGQLQTFKITSAKKNRSSASAATAEGRPGLRGQR